MTVFHHAYTFDPYKFHDQLGNAIVVGNQIENSRLIDQVKRIIDNGSPQLFQILHDLRFDKDWLEDSDPEVSKAPFWYMITLAGSLTFAPSLSNRLQAGWLVLKQALPHTGWTDQEIKQLIEGDPLHSLVESSKNAVLINEFQSGVDQFGGWLEFSRIEALLQHLTNSRDQFLNPSASVKGAVAHFSEWWSEPILVIMQKAYADASEMLETAINQNKSLFMVLD